MIPVRLQLCQSTDALPRDVEVMRILFNADALVAKTSIVNCLIDPA